MVLVCVHGKSATNAAIKANGVLCVNCLQADQSELSQAFAGIGSMPMRERFALAHWDALVTGAPRCKDALVALDCEVAEVRDIGTHSVFIAKVLATSEARQRRAAALSAARLRDHARLVTSSTTLIGRSLCCEPASTISIR